jgi:hypothetical protein
MINVLGKLEVSQIGPIINHQSILNFHPLIPPGDPDLLHTFVVGVLAIVFADVLE